MTQHYSQFLVPVVSFARRSPVELLHSLDGTGEVAAVVREVPHDDRKYSQSGLVSYHSSTRVRYSV